MTTTLENMLEILGYRVFNFDHALQKPMINKEYDKLIRIAKKWDVLSDFP